MKAAAEIPMTSVILGLRRLSAKELHPGSAWPLTLREAQKEAASGCVWVGSGALLGAVGGGVLGALVALTFAPAPEGPNLYFLLVYGGLFIAGGVTVGLWLGVRLGRFAYRSYGIFSALIREIEFPVCLASK